MPSTSNQYQYKINRKKSNIDFQYGVYSDIANAKENLLDGGMASNLLFDNGYTFAVYEDGNVVEYAFHGIGENTTVQQVYSNFNSFVKKKVSATTWTDVEDKPMIEGYNLNSGNNSASSLGLATSLQGTKADNAIPKVNGTSSNEIPVFNSNGELVKSDKILSNMVFWGETVTPKGSSVDDGENIDEPEEPNNEEPSNENQEIVEPE